MIMPAPGVDIRRHDAGEYRAEHSMDRLQEFLERVRDHGLAVGKFRGILHVAIGRTVKVDDGTVISTGTTWRLLSHLLKAAKFDKELVRQLNVDPDEISPRDRERFWYSAIALARPDSTEAIAEAEVLIPLLAPLGYSVGPLPSGFAASLPPAASSKTKSVDGKKAGSKSKKS